MPDTAEFHRERDRVVERLRTMPLAKLSGAADLAYDAACGILERSADAGRTLPRLADHAAGDQLAVITDDFLRADPDDADVQAATAILTGLRRSLP